MMLSELGSTAAEEMSVFQRLLLEKGTKPFRLAAVQAGGLPGCHSAACQVSAASTAVVASARTAFVAAGMRHAGTACEKERRQQGERKK
jgi:hypothetical protein